jgi:hypothetical protein
MPQDKDKYSLPNNSGSQVSGITTQEFLRRAAEALRKASPEQLAQARQRLLDYLQYGRRSSTIEPHR